MVIHDRSYARWKGDRSRPVAAVPVILGTGLRRSMTILFRRKLIAIPLLLASYGLFVFAFGFLLVKHYVLLNLSSFPEAAEFMQNDEVAEAFSANPETVWWYLVALQSPFVVVACLLFGSGLIAEDRRSNALELYFSRPVSVAKYLLGKFATIGVLIAFVTLIPALVLVLIETSMAVTESGGFVQKAGLLGRTVLVGAIVISFPSLLVLAASSLTLRARNAAILFLGGVVMLELVISIPLAEIFNEPLWNLLRPGFNVSQVSAWILGATEPLDESVPVWASAVVLAAWVAVLVPLLVRRVRPVEVVA